HSVSSTVSVASVTSGPMPSPGSMAICRLLAMANPQKSATQQWPSAGAHAQQFYFHELIQAVLRAFTAQAGFLDAAERGGGVGNHALVDADHAAFQRFGHTPATVNVTAVEIGSQAERCVVGFANGFVFGPECHHRSERPEGFLAAKLHVRRDTGEQGGLHETAATRVSLTAEQALRTLVQGIADMGLDF